MNFVNIWASPHAIDVIRRKYDDPTEEGEVTHFQALATALSATVGLGSIAGVAIAISVGGPGAAFWMTVSGLLGMTSKFVECTLGVKYRVVILTGVYNSPEFAHLGGAQLTSAAFGMEIEWFPIVLGLSCFLFAFSTMISWGYYGERS